MAFEKIHILQNFSQILYMLLKVSFFFGKLYIIQVSISFANMLRKFDSLMEGNSRIN